MTFNMDAYREWRQAHPAQPLHRDVEESLIIEIAMLRDEVAMLQQEARIRKNLCDGLAEEVSYLRACVPPTRPTDYGHEVWAETVRSEVRAERAAVVAWLRKHWSEVLEQTPQQTAKLIERGEHRREEEP